RQNILIVDDRVENLVALETILAPLEVESVRATSGNEALSLSLKHSFAMAILDVQMPGMDGYELAEFLRADNNTHLLPVIFMSAALQDEIDIFRGYDAGGVDYITKPYAPQVLLGKVRIFLELDRYRKRLEELVHHRTGKLRHTTKVLRAIRDVNQLIVREKERLPLISEACNLLVRERGFNLAWIILLPSGTQSLLAAQSGYSQPLFDGFTEQFARRELPSCCLQTDNLSGITVINKSDNDCAGCLLMGENRAATALIARLEYDRKLFGYCAVAITSENTDIEEEVSLFREVAGDLAFSLSTIESNENAKKAEHEKEQASRETRALLQGTRAVLMEPDLESAIERILNICMEYLDVETSLFTLLNEQGLPEGAAFIRGADPRKTLIPDLAPFLGEIGAQARLENKTFQLHDLSKIVQGLRLKPLEDSHLHGLVTPVLLQHEVVGIFVYFLKGQADESTTRIIDSFAEITAVAIREHRTQGELIKSERKHRTYVETAPEAIFVANSQGQYVHVNGAASRMTGYSREELLNMSIPQIVAPENLSETLATFEHLKKAGQIENELIFSKKDGGRIHVLLKAVSISDDHFMGFCSDITARYVAEQALRDSEERYKTIMMQSADCLILHDMKGNIVDANQRAAASFGVSREEFLSLNVRDIDPSFDKKIHLKELFSRENEGAIVEFESLHRSKDGTLFPMEVRMCLVHIGDKTLVQGMYRDITERKRAEDEKLKLEEQLSRSQRMESVGRLAGGIAHDFNNILTAISGFSEIVMESFAPEDPRREDVAEIMKASDSAASLTGQLLAFSRRQILSPKVISLNKAIAFSEKMLRRIIGEDLDFVFFPGEHLGNVLMDPGQVDQILVNLAVNARDAMKQGGKLTIETAMCFLEEKHCSTCNSPIVGEYILMAVSDNGQGMTPEVMAKIFEPFYTTKETGRGTGLG
ncbi:PAS domain S-box protein, partial [Myxococcota bacterium]|nr:PAS domain S-box protein [Myxococcota bacterium]